MVIGYIKELDFYGVSVWLNSPGKCYNGRRILLADRSTDALTIKRINDGGCEVVTTGPPNDKPHTCRYYHYWSFLKKLHPETGVLLTDVRDVVFQTNPFPMFTGSEVCVAQEETNHFEPINNSWLHQLSGGNNPEFVNYMIGRTVLNAGVIGGKAGQLAGLCLLIYLMTAYNPYTMLDQTALNCILTTVPYRHITRIFTLNDAWSINMHFSNSRVFKGSGLCNDRGQEFAIVHQYDRHPELVEYFRKLYK